MTRKIVATRPGHGSLKGMVGSAGEWAVEDINKAVDRLLGRPVTVDLNEVTAAETTRSDSAADWLATHVGSWGFVIGFSVFIVIWMLVNVALLSRGWDPYPFVFLNLFLSCVAALQAPIIMMSQRRQEERDRRRADMDYQVNLKNEVLIEHLTRQVDGLALLLQEERLVAKRGL